jgi:hypothetical protein
MDDDDMTPKGRIETQIMDRVKRDDGITQPRNIASCHAGRKA